MTKAKSLALGALAVVILGLVIAVSRSRPTEEEAWAGCQSKPIKECKVPSGYDPIVIPCSKYLDCLTAPPSAAYASSTRTNIAGGIKGGNYRYAVLGLDAAGNITQIEIKTFYAAP